MAISMGITVSFPYFSLRNSKGTNNKNALDSWRLRWELFLYLTIGKNVFLLLGYLLALSIRSPLRNVLMC
jgi:hypothetical protein